MYVIIFHMWIMSKMDLLYLNKYICEPCNNVLSHDELQPIEIVPLVSQCSSWAIWFVVPEVASKYENAFVFYQFEVTIVSYPDMQPPYCRRNRKQKNDYMKMRSTDMPFYLLLWNTNFNEKPYSNFKYSLLEMLLCRYNISYHWFIFVRFTFYDRSVFYAKKCDIDGRIEGGRHSMLHQFV